MSMGYRYVDFNTQEFVEKLSDVNNIEVSKNL